MILEGNAIFTLSHLSYRGRLAITSISEVLYTLCFLSVIFFTPFPSWWTLDRSLQFNLGLNCFITPAPKGDDFTLYTTIISPCIPVY